MNDAVNGTAMNDTVPLTGNAMLHAARIASGHLTCLSTGKMSPETSPSLLQPAPRSMP